MTKSVELVIQKLEQLAGALRIGVEEIYPYFVERVIVEAVVGLSLITITFGATWSILMSISRRAKNSDGDNFDIFAPLIIGMLISAFLFFGIIKNLPNIIAPQVVAIERIIALIK